MSSDQWIWSPAPLLDKPSCLQMCWRLTEPAHHVYSFKNQKLKNLVKGLILLSSELCVFNVNIHRSPPTAMFYVIVMRICGIYLDVHVLQQILMLCPPYMAMIPGQQHHQLGGGRKGENILQRPRWRSLLSVGEVLFAGWWCIPLLIPYIYIYIYTCIWTKLLDESDKPPRWWWATAVD